MSEQRKALSLWDKDIVSRALVDSIWKFDPRIQIKNPVMFVVEVTALAVTIIMLRRHLQAVTANSSASNFRSRSGCGSRSDSRISPRRWLKDAARRKPTTCARRAPRPMPGLLKDGKERMVAATDLRRGDVVLVRAGEVIAGDGEVVEGVAAVNEAAITGESAPVIRESGGDRSAVTGGTTVISDWIKVKITANPGETFLDRMIALVEGAQRQKTPNEIALSILLAGLTIIFMLVCVSLYPFAQYGGTALSLPVLVALLVCLIPTTIGGLLSAIGIAGMDRLVQHNVLAMSGRAVEAAGDVDTLLLDKTGTITLGDRMATEFIPVERRRGRGSRRCGSARLAG